MARSRPVLALLAALTLGLSGCASATAPARGSGSGPAQQASAAGSLDFTASTLDGTTLDAATLAGKPVVLWFWAPF
jgi:cytochrome oxidase Cu insertion factor (SCO1/SenC/PrrC family)